MRPVHMSPVKAKSMITNSDKRWRSSLPAFMIACASAFALSGCGESPAAIVATPQSGLEVLLLPVLRGGATGWCIAVAPRSGCPISRLKNGPIVAEHWMAGGVIKPIGTENAIPANTKPTDLAEGFALTTSQVAAVAVDGSTPVATRRGPGLPQGLREVAVRILGAWAPEVETPSLFGGPAHKAPAHLPRFTPLGRAGKPLTQRNEAGPLVVHEHAGRTWSPPQHEPAGACELRASQLHGLVTNAGFVVTRARPVSGLIGRPFLSCASVSYTLKGWPMVGSVLLDARQPGRQPASLPRLRSVIGSAGVFDALGSNGPMVARRVTGAWLVVSGGEGAAQRLTLLEHLRATLHL
jgi:hypothetical protein